MHCTLYFFKVPNCKIKMLYCLCLFVFNVLFVLYEGLPGGPGGKEPSVNSGGIREAGLIPGWGRSPGGGHSNPLQCSCLENSMDRGAWWALVQGSTESGTKVT